MTFIAAAAHLSGIAIIADSCESRAGHCIEYRSLHDLIVEKCTDKGISIEDEVPGISKKVYDIDGEILTPKELCNLLKPLVEASTKVSFSKIQKIGVRSALLISGSIEFEGANLDTIIKTVNDIIVAKNIVDAHEICLIVEQEFSKYLLETVKTEGDGNRHYIFCSYNASKHQPVYLAELGFFKVIEDGYAFGLRFNPRTIKTAGKLLPFIENTEFGLGNFFASSSKDLTKEDAFRLLNLMMNASILGEKYLGAGEINISGPIIYAEIDHEGFHFRNPVFSQDFSR